MVHAPDRICTSRFVINDFPVDRAASPAWLTIPASWLYVTGATAYHKWHDQRAAYRAPVPVISIGNITVGGTGKTPTIIALAKLIHERFPHLWEPNATAVLSRGYGRRSKELVAVETNSDWRETGDEPLLIKRAVPDVAVIVHADRCLAADYAVQTLKSKLILLDDGFQHRRLARDLDLVIVDGEHPLGNGYFLPAGPLREPAANLARASALIVVGESNVSASRLNAIVDKPFCSAYPQVELPSALSGGSMHRVFAFAGIARPNRFLNTLLKLNLKIVGHRFFRDHHAYRYSDFERLTSEALALGAEALVTTEKDQMRISEWTYPIPLVSVGLEICFSDPDFVYEMLTKTVLKT